MGTRDHMEEDRFGISQFFPRGKTDREIQLVLRDAVTPRANIGTAIVPNPVLNAFLFSGPYHCHMKLYVTDEETEAQRG